MKKFWNLKNSEAEGESARLDLFGVIGADGFWEQGFDENSFKNDMALIPAEAPLDIYINSDGGSVFAAIAIHNMIKRHKGKVTITVAGMAASAATIITSVPNAHVIMPAGSMMMIHPPLTYAGWANASQLREYADVLDKIGGSIIDIYRQKSNCSEEQIIDMVSRDTFLTAEEAVELGFADEFDASYQIAAVRSEGNFIINNLSIPEGKFKNLPVSNTGVSEKGEEIMELTYDELKANHPELFEQVKNEGRLEGVASERERIKSIEEVADVADELAFKAKFEEPMDAGAYAIAALKRDKAKGAAFLNHRAKDAGGVNNLEAHNNGGLTPNEEKEKAEKAELEACIAAAHRGFEARNKK